MIQGFVNVADCDKENLCEDVYNKYIVETYEFLRSCENYSALVRARIPEVCYTNFRDALFHFRKLYRTDEWNELNCQAFAIREHANRAKTDAAVTLIRKSAKTLGFILRKPSLPKELIPVIADKHDALRNMEMYIRLGGMMIGDVNGLKPSYKQILDCFDEFSSFCDKNVQSLFHEVMHEWPKDDPDHLEK